MPDLQALLDQIDRLDQEATKGPWEAEHTTDESDQPPSVLSKPEHQGTRQLIAWVDPSNTDADFIALSRTALPQLAKALRTVIESCEETIQSVDQYLLPDERDHANRDHADMILDAIIDAMKADHAG